MMMFRFHVLRAARAGAADAAVMMIERFMMIEAGAYRR